MAPRRMGSPDASIRFELLDATDRVMARDGYSAVSSRSVGDEAGVDQKLVYYYFRNMEELVVAAFRRRSEIFLNNLEKIAEAESPIHALWALNSDGSVRLMIEFQAMATHNAALRKEIGQVAVEVERIIDEALSPGLSKTGLDPSIFTAEFTHFLIAALARSLIADSELGVLRNPDGIRRSIELIIDRLSGRSTTA